MIRVGSLVRVGKWSDFGQRRTFAKNSIAIVLVELAKPNIFDFDYKILFGEKIIHVHKHEIKEVPT